MLCNNNRNFVQLPQGDARVQRLACMPGLGYQLGQGTGYRRAAPGCRHAAGSPCMPVRPLAGLLVFFFFYSDVLF